MGIDPLEEMLTSLPDKVSQREIDAMMLRACKYLDQLQELLDNPPAPPKKIDYYAKSSRSDVYPIYAFDSSDLPRAQELYKRVALTGGAGVTFEQQFLLRLIGTSASTSTIPFWLEMLDFAGRPRDAFTPERKAYALAALAFLSIARDSQEARDAMLQATQHSNPAVRALAAYYLTEAYLAVDHDLPLPVAARLRQIAIEDQSFEPRFQARLALRYTGFPVPHDNPDGVYRFEVKLDWAPDVLRVIELRSKQTLEDLHFSIQKAFDWGADHLYTFYMNGKEDDDLYEIKHPALEDGPMFAFPLFAPPGMELQVEDEEEEESEGDEEDDTLYPHNAVIGELGLVKGHKFIYFFDFGDSHTFRVKVADIKASAEKGRYPRVVERKGDNPPQYETWDEEDEEDEEEE
jgi:hypothetical protein